MASAFPGAAGARLIRVLVAWALAFVLTGLNPSAADASSRLPEFLQKIAPGAVFPGADRFGPVEGAPPAAAVFAGGRRVGYVYLNSEAANAIGYSGKPIDIVVGLSLDGKIVGAKLVEHHEPIVLIGIPQAKIERFISGYIGWSPKAPSAGRAGGPAVDIVSGATVTVLVIGDSLTRSATAVARSRGLGAEQRPAGQAAAPAAGRTLDEGVSRVESWDALLGDGSVRRLRLSVGEVNKAFERSGDRAAMNAPEPGDRHDAFIDLYVAPVSVPSIGRSLLGDAGWRDLKARLQPGQQALLIAGDGTYSFKGSGYVRGGIFERIEIVQGENSLRFRDRDHQRIGEIAAAGAPELGEIGVFTAPEGALDPAAPWRLKLLVQRAVGATNKAFLTFDLGYALPAKYLKGAPAGAAPPAAGPMAAAAPTAPPEAATAAGSMAQAGPAQAVAGSVAPMWPMIWRAKAVQIGVLVAALLVLTAAFFFQDWLVRRPVFYARFRLVFLAFTLVWIGWYVKAQLSVVNVLTFTNALREDFRWEYFLMDPLVFILWSATATAILFWNRGAFCGWLCPFGALQELLNRGARALRVAQVRVPFGLHQRLWALKYVIFLVLFGVSLYGLATAERMAEVEPFKTAIVLRFMRAWPFLAFALALLAASLFIERFFCRYLCPLGAALAIPARLRVFDWLRRYRECGNPCQHCATGCPVQAIHPEGHINPNECIQCLHCQMLYHDDRKCPAMIQKRLKREKRQAISGGVALPASAGRAGAQRLEEPPRI